MTNTTDDSTDDETVPACSRNPDDNPNHPFPEDHDPTEPGPLYVPEDRHDTNPFIAHDSYEECIEADEWGDDADGDVYHADRPLIGKRSTCQVCYRGRTRFYDAAGDLREVEYRLYLGDTEAVEEVDHDQE